MHERMLEHAPLCDKIVRCSAPESAHEQLSTLWCACTSKHAATHVVRYRPVRRSSSVGGGEERQRLQYPRDHRRAWSDVGSFDHFCIFAIWSEWA